MASAFTVDSLALNSIPGLFTASPDDTEFFDQYFVLQVLGVKLMPQNTKTAVERTRLILSDSTLYLQAMHTAAHGELANMGVDKLSIVRVRLSCSFVQERRLLVISEIEVLGKAPRLGEPVAIDKKEKHEDSPATEGKPASSSKTPQPQSAQVPAKPKPQPPRQQAQRAASSGTRTIHPIEGLSPYGNSWTIKAMCTQKSDMKKWSNPRGEGKLFNVTLLDETGEIRGTAFNGVADQLYDLFEEGNVYYVSKARVNLAKKMFSNLQNDYELSFEKNTEVELCTDTTDLPTIKYHFVGLDKLIDILPDSTCDVFALVKEVGTESEITSKQNRKTIKRDLTLVDETGYSVRLTLWGKQAEQYKTTPEEETRVLVLKGVRVGDFGGRTLSMVSTSIMSVNPDIPEVHGLLGWYDRGGKEASFQVHVGTGQSSGAGFNRNELLQIAQIKAAPVPGEKPDFFSSRATVMHIRSQNIAYPACETCNKKVTQNTDDSWKCEACNKSYPKPLYRYMITMAVADATGQAWYNGFNEVGETVFGVKADVLVEKQQNNEEEFNVMLHKACGRVYNFACRAKADSYNDNVRVRYGISRIEKLNYATECSALLDLLSSPWGRGR